MSTEQVAVKAKETLKAVKEILEKTEASVNKGLTKAAPSVQKSLDASLEAAARGFTSTLKTIDSVTEKEQLEVLNAYNKFLAGQSEFVKAKIRSIEERSSKGAPAGATS